MAVSVVTCVSGVACVSIVSTVFPVSYPPVEPLLLAEVELRKHLVEVAVVAVRVFACARA